MAEQTVVRSDLEQLMRVGLNWDEDKIAQVIQLSRSNKYSVNENKITYSFVLEHLPEDEARWLLR